MMFENNKFLSGISFDENPYVEETPEETAFFDLSGNEVSIDGNE